MTIIETYHVGNAAHTFKAIEKFLKKSELPIVLDRTYLKNGIVSFATHLPINGNESDALKKVLDGLIEWYGYN